LEFLQRYNNSMGVSLLAFLFYTLGWWVCILSGAYEMGWIAVFYTALTLSIIFILSSAKIFALRAIAVLFSLLLGVILETLFMWLGIIHYGAFYYFPPIWILLLYPLFGILLIDFLSIFETKLIAAFCAATVAAGMIYSSGNAIVNSETLPFWNTLFIGISWGALFVFMLLVTKKIKMKADSLEKEANSHHYTLLVDESCSLCSAEVAHLKKRESGKPVHFVDISADDYDPSKYRFISRETAMEQIHGIDHEENVQTGIDAFVQVYARTDHMTLALLYSLPLTRPVAAWAYKLFAKNRHFLSGKKS
jgi:predicted DCC family thiol-disulfide oxidoreductase YuxK